MSADQITDLYKLIRDRWWMVAEQFGTMVAALGQAQASLMLDSIGRRTPTLRPTQGIRDEKAALGGPDLRARSGRLLHCWRRSTATWMDANAEAIIDLAEDAKAEVLWQPSGLTTCYYCLRRAKHGSYSDFRSQAQREGFQTRPHAFCDCCCILVASEDDWPEDYRLTEYFREIDAGTASAGTGKQPAAMPATRPLDPKTRQSRRRDQSAQAWAERQRITAEDAAKKRIEVLN